MALALPVAPPPTPVSGPPSPALEAMQRETGSDDEANAAFSAARRGPVLCSEEDALVDAFGATGMTSRVPNIETGLPEDVERSLARAVCAAMPPDFGLGAAMPDSVAELPHLLLRALKRRSRQSAGHRSRGAIDKGQERRRIIDRLNEKFPVQKGTSVSFVIKLAPSRLGSPQVAASLTPVAASVFCFNCGKHGHAADACTQLHQQRLTCRDCDEGGGQSIMAEL